MPRFLQATDAHGARQEAQISMRLRAEAHRAELEAKATRRTRGTTASDLFYQELSEKQSLVDEKIARLDHHDKVQKTFEEEAVSPRFMRLTQTQADRASVIIRKRDDWEKRVTEKKNKELRAAMGPQAGWGAVDSAKQIEEVKKSMEGTIVDQIFNSTNGSTSLSLPPGSRTTTRGRTQPENGDVAPEAVYPYMRPTHSSKLQTRTLDTLEYHDAWKDRQYLIYDIKVNPTRVPARPYLAPHPPVMSAGGTQFPPPEDRRVKNEYQRYYPALSQHLNRCAINPRSPHLAQMKQIKARGPPSPRAATARIHQRETGTYLAPVPKPIRMPPHDHAPEPQTVR